MATVFVYGPDSLQAKMYDKLGPCDVLGGATVEGYRVAFDKPNMKQEDEGLPNLRAEEGAEAFGVLYDLSNKQAETWEGYYGGYGRKELSATLLPRGDRPAKKLKARTMIARRTDDALKASKANLEASIQGAEENGASEAFIESLKNLETFDE